MATTAQRTNGVKQSAALTARGPVGIGIVAFAVVAAITWIVVTQRK